jgi:hypothetical protein
MMQSSAQREPIRRPNDPPKNQAQMRHTAPAWTKHLTPQEREERAAVIASKGTRSLNRLVQIVQPPPPAPVRWLKEPFTIPGSTLKILGVCADASPELQERYADR